MDPITFGLAAWIGAKAALHFLRRNKRAPEAFIVVERNLHLAGETLRLLSQSLTDHPRSITEPLCPFIDSCQSQIEGIKETFYDVGFADALNSPTTDWSTIIDFYRQLIVPLGKASKVEIKMQHLLEDLELLIEDPLLELSEQKRELESARMSLIEVEPSLPDSDFRNQDGFILRRETLNQLSRSQMRLRLAAMNGNQDVVKSLLEDGRLNSSLRDETGRTPLSWAAERGHQMIVERLLKGGSDHHTRDKRGRTPLSLAAEKGWGEIVQVLLRVGAIVNSEDETGWTPLAWAAAKGHKGVVLQLNGDYDDEAHGRNSEQTGWALPETDENLLMTNAPSLLGGLDVTLHHNSCAHKLDHKDEAASNSHSALDLQTQYLRRLDMHRQLSLLCGLGGVLPPTTDTSNNLGWAKFSCHTASVFFTDKFDDPELLLDLDLSPRLFLQLRETMTRVVFAATILQHSGFCCNQFTILVAAQRENNQASVRMKTIPFISLIRLEESYHGVLYDALALTECVSQSRDILESLFDIRLSRPSTLEAMVHFCSLTTQALCLGLVLYSRAHVQCFHPTYLTDALNEVILRGSSPNQPHIVVEQEELACMGEMVGGKVFVFRMISQTVQTEIVEFSGHLEATCEEIVDSWGPGSLLFASIDGVSDHKIIGLVIRGGVIEPYGRLSNGNRLFHWGDQPIKPDSSLAETFGYRDRILIGAKPMGAPPLRPTEIYGAATINVDCERDHLKTWKASQRYRSILGTEPSAWKLVERNVIFQGGYQFILQAGAAQTKQPGVHGKRAVLDRWVIEKKLSLFEEFHGLQVSLCTGVARRVPLRVLIRDDLMEYLESLPIPKWKALKHQAKAAMATRNGFEDWYTALDDESMTCVKEVFHTVLHRLKDTGFDKNGVRFAIVWPKDSEARYCVKITPEGDQEWCRMLEDTEWSTTFAVATKLCLKAPSYKCKGTRDGWGGMKMLSTFVSESISDKAPLADDARAWQIEHNKWYWGGKVGGEIMFLARKPSKEVAELEFHRCRLHLLPRRFWSIVSHRDVVKEIADAGDEGEDVFIVPRS